MRPGRSCVSMLLLLLLQFFDLLAAQAGRLDDDVDVNAFGH